MARYYCTRGVISDENSKYLCTCGLWHYDKIRSLWVCLILLRKIILKLPDFDAIRRSWYCNKCWHNQLMKWEYCWVQLHWKRRRTPSKVPMHQSENPRSLLSNCFEESKVSIQGLFTKLGPKFFNPSLDKHWILIFFMQSSAHCLMSLVTVSKDSNNSSLL